MNKLDILFYICVSLFALNLITLFKVYWLEYKIKRNNNISKRLEDFYLKDTSDNIVTFISKYPVKYME